MLMLTQANFDSDKFTYNKNTRTFVQEASTLQLGAMPNKIALTSVKTGKTLIFYNFVTVYEGQGEDREVVGWRYHNCANELVIEVLND